MVPIRNMPKAIHSIVAVVIPVKTPFLDCDRSIAEKIWYPRIVSTGINFNSCIPTDSNRGGAAGRASGTGAVGGCSGVVALAGATGVAAGSATVLSTSNFKGPISNSLSLAAGIPSATRTLLIPAGPKVARRAISPHIQTDSSILKS